MTHHLLLILRFINLTHHSESNMYKIYHQRPITKNYSFLYDMEFYPFYFNRIGEYIFITFTMKGKLYISIRGDRPEPYDLRSSLFKKVRLDLDVYESCNVHINSYNYLRLAYSDIKSQICSYLNIYPEGEIEFCGYSSGGYVAIIATIKFQYIYQFNRFHCTTFGSFKPGGTTLSNKIRKLPGRIQNYLLEDDLISSLPPEDQGYIMPRKVIISKNRCFNFGNRNRIVKLKDYFRSIENCSFIV